MDKEIQMGKDQIITDELRRGFCLNEDPESEELLRVPILWRHLFSASAVKQAASEVMQSRINLEHSWSRLRAEYYMDAAEKKAVGISEKRRLPYNSPYYSYSGNPCFSVSVDK